jgi:D-sedoheptulose 7-phosphate isomerase
MSNSYTNIKNVLKDSLHIKNLILNDEFLLSEISKIIDVVVVAFKNGNRVFFGGNGGSAADAQHLAAEFVSRFEFDRPGLSASSLSTDTSILTAIGNDYGFDKLFVRQLEAHSRKGDIFFGITTSGKSPNIISAFEICKPLQLISIGFLGQNGLMPGIDIDHKILVPSQHTARIQECHILIGHIICGEVERILFKSGTAV